MLMNTLRAKSKCWGIPCVQNQNVEEYPACKIKMLRNTLRACIIMKEYVDFLTFSKMVRIWREFHQWIDVSVGEGVGPAGTASRSRREQPRAFSLKNLENPTF
jgi:hypothetical protein